VASYQINKKQKKDEIKDSIYTKRTKINHLDKKVLVFGSMRFLISTKKFQPVDTQKTSTL